tara:strand:+ start:64 stop:666 length:603 start_codon:yes stop_codon:yes gene_type:complete
MATCLITSGYATDCKNQIGGIKEVYFTSDYNNNCRTSATAGATDGTITAGGLSSWSIYGTPTASKVQIYKYELRQNLSSATVNLNSDPLTATTFFEQTLNLQLTKITPAQANELRLIAYSRPQVFIVDHNNTVMCFGWDNGMDVSGGTLVTGVAKGDMSGFTLDLRAEEKEAAIFLNSSGPGTAGYPFDGISDHADFDIN